MIGKNVWKFHAIYWVGLLLSTGLHLPNEIFIHGFLTVNGEKISKSTGNAIDPVDVLKKYDSDILRCYLLGKISFEQDSDFNEDQIATFYLQELLNQLGNLYPRILSIAQKNNFSLKDENQTLEIPANNLSELFREALSQTQDLNKKVNDSLIWKSANKAEIETFLNEWELQLQLITSLVRPFLPNRTEQLGLAFRERVILFEKGK